MMNPRPVIKAAIVITALAMAIPVFRREFTELRNFPSYVSMTYEERKVRMDGPVFRLAARIEALTPAVSSVIFLHEDGSYFRKAAYYLYPRTLKPINEIKRIGELKDTSDYMVVFLPASQAGKDLFASLDAAPSFENLYEQDGGAIYRIRKGGR